MNRLINNTALIAVAVIGMHADAFSTLDRDSDAAQSCRTHVVRDAEGARLHYLSAGWIAKGDKPNQTQVFLNALATQHGALVPRRVQCVVTHFGNQILAADVQAGRFVDRRTA